MMRCADVFFKHFRSYFGSMKGIQIYDDTRYCPKMFTSLHLRVRGYRKKLTYNEYSFVILGHVRLYVCDRSMMDDDPFFLTAFG